jgi:hypothetical protein
MVAGQASSAKNDSTLEKNLGETRKHQFAVLRKMSEGITCSRQPRQYQINEISTLSGVHDEKETQRILYILEGHKFVAPYPAGDFTSKVWHITADGVDAVRKLKRTGLTL